VYVKNMNTGNIMIANSNASGEIGDNGASTSRVSADGRYVAFSSFSTNLIPGVTGHNIYLKDMINGSINLVSSDRNGDFINVGSLNFLESISHDGKFVAFRTNNDYLIDGVSGNHAYVKNMETGEVLLGSSSSDGSPASAGSLFEYVGMQLSADGRYLALESNSSNMIEGVTGTRLYRKDLINGNVELVSRSSDDQLGNGTAPSLTSDGQKIVFLSISNDLVTGDTNGVGDIFLRDLSKTGIDELSGMVVSNQVSARITLILSKQRLETLNLARAGIGTSVSRIQTSISNLSSMTQNIASASSQITDTDVAEESAKLLGSQILQQAGAAVLAQANAQPELTLQLIRTI
jgi:flagellin-like hook-associated protein FlgL